MKKPWVKLEDRTDASPWPMYLTLEGYLAPVSRVVGKKGFTGLMVRFIGKNWQFHERKGEWDAFSEKIIQKMQREPDFADLVIRETYRLCGKMLDWTEKIANTDLRKKTNRKLWALLDGYHLRNLDARAYATVAPALDLTSRFTEKLEGILVAKKVKKQAILKTLAILLTPAAYTQEKKQDIALLKIAAKAERLSNKKQTAYLEKALQRHTLKFGWIPCTYEGPPWNQRYFQQVVQGLISLDPNGQLKKIEENDRLTQKKRNEVIRTLRLNREEKRWFDTAAAMGFFKADRKDLFFKSYYQMRPLFSEIARRLGLSAKQVKYLLPEEIKERLLGEKNPDENLLNAREKECVLIVDWNGPRVLQGKDAVRELKNVENIHPVKPADELKGQCANPGRAHGMARLILSGSDVSNMKSGDVLVAHATNPDVVPAMKIASAIVTDTGGITCHAAIVSRELGKPCLIGTKIATKTFKDGDTLTVNATHGWVRILKREKV
ncbi:MAG TPA: PEP-utilizing enzyme [Candidatus Norongarragalinales archaeon]|nr:PEP-utilizing enzyme [Candidatus Norongarragalinales archaeon]